MLTPEDEAMILLYNDFPTSLNSYNRGISIAEQGKRLVVQAEELRTQRASIDITNQVIYAGRMLQGLAKAPLFHLWPYAGLAESTECVCEAYIRYCRWRTDLDEVVQALNSWGTRLDQHSKQPYLPISSLGLAYLGSLLLIDSLKASSSWNTQLRML